jgi:hypothetical protein
MKKIATILLFVMTIFSTLMASLIITWFAWECQITDKAFHCTDDNVSGFWCDMDTHRAAGDTLLNGWTWGGLKMVRSIYELVFYALWIGGGLFLFQRLRRLLNSTPLVPSNRSQEPIKQ